MLLPTHPLTPADAREVGETILGEIVLDEVAAFIDELVSDNIAEYRWADDGDVELVARTTERGQDRVDVLAYLYTGAEPDVDLTHTFHHLREVY